MIGCSVSSYFCRCCIDDTTYFILHSHGNYEQLWDSGRGDLVKYDRYDRCSDIDLLLPLKLATIGVIWITGMMSLL